MKSQFSVIIDGIGGETAVKSYRLLRYGGRLVCYGATQAITSKSELPADIEQTYLPGEVSFQSISENARAVMGSHLGAEPTVLKSWMEEILRLYSTGSIRPHVGQVFPLADAATSHHYLHDRKNIGKVVLVP
jgi:NADPH:quinone reductase-like Zn-dependent oxidoreductase